MKYFFRIILLIIIPFIGQAQQLIPVHADLKKFQSQFYLGAHLCREPMPPMDELKRDMETLKKNGFNMIKLQESWAIDEPEEGKYNFSKYEELISYAKKLGMYVYVGLTCEQAPSWLFEKYPDCRMVGQNGAVITYEAQSTIPADGKPGPCFDHPGAREAQDRFIRKLVEVLGKYDNVLVWNTWQEVGYWSDRLVGQPVCYCPNTMKAFHQWLQEKYGTLENLNKEWNTNYARWEYISPSRNYKQHFTLPQTINWNYFMDNIKISNTLKERADVIRLADPLHRPVFSHMGSWEIGSGTEWNYARTEDFLGSSTYPASSWGEFNDWDDVSVDNTSTKNKYQSELEEMWRMLALRFDYLRSSNEPGHPLWAAEFQGGPVSTGFHMGRVPTPADMRRWMLTAVGSGVNTISFWVARAEIMAAETNGYSLLDSEGDSTARFSEASRIGKALIRHKDIFSQPVQEKSQVAILINENNYQFCADMPTASENLQTSTRGWHRLLWDAGIPVDFINASQIDSLDLSIYNAIILPFPLVTPDGVLKKLNQYVENGGNLISEAGVARYTENAYAVRGEISKTAAQLFGVKQTGFRMVREPNGGHRWSPYERTYGEFIEDTMLYGKDELNGLKTRANVYLQTFTCTDSKPCLWYGDEIAGTVKNIGKGKAWLFGSFIGHSGVAYRDQNTPAFVKQLMNKCKVFPEHEGRLLLRKRKISGKQAWVITNPTDQKITETFETGSFGHATTLFDEPVPLKNKSFSITLDSLDVAVILIN